MHLPYETNLSIAKNLKTDPSLERKKGIAKVAHGKKGILWLPTTGNYIPTPGYRFTRHVSSENTGKCGLLFFVNDRVWVYLFRVSIGIAFLVLRSLAPLRACVAGNRCAVPTWFRSWQWLPRPHRSDEERNAPHRGMLLY